MGFKLEGDYFEACNCEVSCPCIWLGQATEDECHAMLAWHISRGAKDGVALDGLNAALAVRSSKQMTDGNWTVALYLDDKATPEQSEALGAIFSGAAGGHLANLAPLIGTVAGVNPAPITFSAKNGTRSVKVGSELEMEVQELKGMDGATSAVITNPLLGVVTQPLRQGKSDRVVFKGPWTTEFSGRNSFVTEFAYEG